MDGQLPHRATRRDAGPSPASPKTCKGASLRAKSFAAPTPLVSAVELKRPIRARSIR